MPALNLRRRALLKGGLASSALLAARSRALAAPHSPVFTLGVASGYPVPDGVSLWTRLAPEPLKPDGGMSEASTTVHWEVARGADFSSLLAQGSVRTHASAAHSVHVDVRDLPSDTPLCYRFRTGTHLSPTGHTRTAPAADAKVTHLRLAVASCQHYEHDYFSAYRDMRAQAPDLVLHLGDYLYEGSWGRRKVRPHPTPDPVDLTGYRLRHASYRLDPDLAAMHAAAPWVMMWDDHEVENDYARDRSRYHADAARFMARRRAAYQAWYEHMPVPASMAPQTEGMPIYTSLAFGQLAQLTLLDTRQYRSYPACSAGSPAPGWSCAPTQTPTMLGAAQAAWVEGVLRQTRQPWQIIAQGLFMARCDALPGPEEKLFPQNWDGYPAAREALFAALAQNPQRTALVLSGDVHAFWVNELWRDYADRTRGVLGAEVVTSSLSAEGPDEQLIARVLADPDAPWHRFATARHRGYARVDVYPTHAAIELRGLTNPGHPASPCNTLWTGRLEQEGARLHVTSGNRDHQDAPAA